jgi:hypothetical protein
VTARPAAAAAGRRILADFRDDLSLEELRTLLAAFHDDAATATLRATVGDELDLAVAAHRVALLGWLRSWGCRHLRVADTARSSAALSRWWRRWSESLPPVDRPLTRLGAGERERLGAAYAALASLRVASRAAATGVVAVTFGDTAAAKALHAIRPRACPPWDEPIRLAFGPTRADGALYASYLAGTADALRGCARRLDVRVGDLPSLLGRPAMTPARVIDEYLWLRVTRGR